MPGAVKLLNISKPNPVQKTIHNSSRDKRAEGGKHKKMHKNVCKTIR